MSRALRNDIKLGLAASWPKHRQNRQPLSVPTSAAASISFASSANITVAQPVSTIVPTFQQSYAKSLPLQRNLSTQAAEIRSTPPPEGSLAIVFTDIVKSTHIWEQSPEAMKEAMSLHDDLIRSMTAHHDGYEVKQNGDGFMIAFQTAIAALEFCINVQKRLMDVDWPKQLLDMGAGSEVRKDENENGGEVLWKGLRLRMSAHFGEPVCTWNELIDRMDYLGPMVNRAARFIQVTEGGQIVVSEEFLWELQKAKSLDQTTGEDGPLYNAVGASSNNNNKERMKFDLKDLQAEHTKQILTDKQFEIRLLGERHFKGLKEMQKLYFIIPYSLRARLEYWPKHMHVAGSKGNLVG